MPKGETIEQFASSMHLVLDLVDKYPHDSLNTHILDVVVQFLPIVCQKVPARGMERPVGNRSFLCKTRFVRKGTDNNFKCNQFRNKRNTSIQDRVVYVEH